MALAPPSSPATATPQRPLSLFVIFLTLYIDLVGFSIIFPLGPDLIAYYLKVDGQSGLLGQLIAWSNSAAHLFGQQQAFSAVLFGGVLTSFFSILQFLFSPVWGSLSDRRGRRGVLLMTVAGTALGYLVWVVSGSFWLFLLSRIVSGAFSGNLSVATAAVADVTTRQERSKAMGIVGAAFGLGLVTGPMLGGLSIYFHLDLLRAHPGLARWGINPFSVPALIALLLCTVNWFWVRARFRETLPESARQNLPDERTRNPLRAILLLDDPLVRRANLVAFVYSVAFVAMESCLTFLAFQRFGFTAVQNTKLLTFLGICSIVTQGYIIRKLLKAVPEVTVLSSGLILSTVGLAVIAWAGQPWLLYVGLAFLATGSGLVNPSTSGLISLYSNPAQQGRVLGVFRSLGSLSRAITPLLAGVVFWAAGATAVFAAAAVIAIGAWVLARRLPQPEK